MIRHAISNLNAWLAILAVVLSSSAGDVLLSRAMKQIGDLGQMRSRRGFLFVTLLILRNRYFLLGVACMAVVNPDASTRPMFPELLEEGFEPFEIRHLWIPAWDGSIDTYVDISETIDAPVITTIYKTRVVTRGKGDEIWGWAMAYGGSAKLKDQPGVTL